MLFGIFCVLALGAGMGVCASAGAFEGLGWLWLLPAVFVGALAVLAGLWALLLVCMSAAVRMDRPQEKSSRFYRAVTHLTVDLLIPLLRVRVHTEGLEQTPADGRFLLVCNHLDDPDPVVLLHCFRRSRLAFISKQENDLKPIIGPFQHRLLCQPINRENDRQALRTILRCIQILQQDLASVAVFPEGYVSLDRKLHPFRPGVFKIAQKAHVPIVVCTLRNTHCIFPNSRRLRPTDVYLHLLEVIPASELEGVTTVDISARVHALMADDLGPDLVAQETT